MRVISTIVMPGGWHFRQKLVSSPQRPLHQQIGGASFDQLLENVLKFRLNNLEMIESGSATEEKVAKDVMFYICGHYPGNCTGSRAQLEAMAAGHGPKENERIRRNYSRPSNRVEDWLTILTERQLRWVDISTAIERAKICLKCPMHQPWRTRCKPCNDNVDRRVALVRGSHKTGYESKMKSCLVFGTMTELSVWLENDHSSSSKKVPPACWKAKS